MNGWSYLELYEEGEIKHINGVWPVLSVKHLFVVKIILQMETKFTVEPQQLNPGGLLIGSTLYLLQIVQIAGNHSVVRSI